MVYTNNLSAAQHNLPVMKKIIRLIYGPVYTVLGYPRLIQVYLKFCVSYLHVENYFLKSKQLKRVSNYLCRP